MPKKLRKFSLERNIPRTASPPETSWDARIPSPHMAGVGALCRASLSAESAEGLGTFVAKRKAVVRAGAELDSPVVTNLEKGNVIIAQEVRNFCLCLCLCL